MFKQQKLLFPSACYALSKLDVVAEEIQKPGVVVVYLMKLNSNCVVDQSHNVQFNFTQPE